MSDTVWISTAMGDPSNMRPLKTNFRDTELLDASLGWGESNNNGDPLGAEFFPIEIWGTSSAEEADYKLPHLFRAGTFWVVSAAAAEVLRQFDLGQGGLYPVKVMKKDRETPVGGEWFCINFGNRKTALIPEDSVNMRERYIRNGEKGWFPKAVFSDGDFVVSPVALSGPDIWIDPNVGRAFFLSDPLAKALKKAKVDNGFMLGTCRVVSGADSNTVGQAA
jgi:hypothetical protein